MSPSPRGPLLAVLTLLAAGCLAPSAVEEAGGALALAAPAVVDAGGARQAALVWRGPVLAEGDVDARAVTLDVPEGHWDARDGRLAVLLRWPLMNQSSLYEFDPSSATLGFDEPDLDLAVYDGAGKLLASGEERRVVLGVLGLGAAVPHAAAVAFLDEPASGPIEVRVTATHLSTFYEAAVRVEDAPVAGAKRDLLPNLVALPPLHLAVEFPGRESPATGALGIRGCGPEESLSSGAKKCLRFDLGVANVGEGPLEMRLPTRDVAAGLAGNGQAIQRVYDSEGGFTDVPSGTATFHPSHGHFHFSGADTVRLHAYDWETGTRGEAVGEYVKTGLCYADLTLADLSLPGTTVAAYLGQGCIDPLQDDGFYTGLSVNWVDVYPAEYPDQFLDVTDVPDGVYEIVVSPNGDGSIVESDTTDNEAGAVFRMTGAEIEVLRRDSRVAPMP